jgi:hypothetical protein
MGDTLQSQVVGPEGYFGGYPDLDSSLLYSLVGNEGYFGSRAVGSEGYIQWDLRDTLVGSEGYIRGAIVGSEGHLEIVTIWYQRLFSPLTFCYNLCKPTTTIR